MLLLKFASALADFGAVENSLPNWTGKRMISSIAPKQAQKISSTKSKYSKMPKVKKPNPVQRRGSAFKPGTGKIKKETRFQKPHPNQKATEKKAQLNQNWF